MSLLKNGKDCEFLICVSESIQEGERKDLTGIPDSTYVLYV
jgi:hypothetical protein